MTEPKIPPKKEESAVKEAEQPSKQGMETKAPENTNTMTPQEQLYWNWVRSVKLLSMDDMAVFKVSGGLVIVPTDAIGRALLDSALFLRVGSPAELKLLGALEIGED